jgi:hypothetical protein
MKLAFNKDKGAKNTPSAQPPNEKPNVVDSVKSESIQGTKENTPQPELKKISSSSDPQKKN